MPNSPYIDAKRALVALLRHLAITYGIIYGITRDSSDQDVIKFSRKVVLKVHPDRGGNKKHQSKVLAVSCVMVRPS